MIAAAHALAGLLLLANPASDDEGQAPAPQAPAPQAALPMCAAGAVAPEAALFAALEENGLRFESRHSNPMSGPEITFAGKGLWVRMLADGGRACVLAAGRDEETST